MQVSLPADEYELVKKQARALGISIAEVIRRAVRDALPHSEGSPLDAIRRVCGTRQS